MLPYVGRLGSGSHLVGRIGSGVRITATFPKIPSEFCFTAAKKRLRHRGFCQKGVDQLRSH